MPQTGLHRNTIAAAALVATAALYTPTAAATATYQASAQLEFWLNYVVDWEGDQVEAWQYTVQPDPWEYVDEVNVTGDGVAGNELDYPLQPITVGDDPVTFEASTAGIATYEGTASSQAYLYADLDLVNNEDLDPIALTNNTDSVLHFTFTYDWTITALAAVDDPSSETAGAYAKFTSTNY